MPASHGKEYMSSQNTPRLWFIADTHFGHTNIIRYSNRPFDSADEHDETLIKNWNARVAPGDSVYHLGDFAFGKKDFALAIRRQLNGNIYLIEGNHDSAAHQIRQNFAIYTQVHEVKFSTPDNPQGRIFCSHYAHRVWNHSHHGAWHLYGHSHNSLPELPDSRSFDIGVDAIAARLSGHPAGMACRCAPEHYRPFSLEEVAEVMGKKSFASVDHHGRESVPTE